MIPRRISHYTLGVKLGEGSFGTVYAAVNELLRRPVAVKVLHAHLVEKESSASRFLEEARCAAALSRPGIVPVRDFIQENGCLAIVMDLIEGVPLDQFLRDHPYLGLSEVVELAARVADALAGLSNDDGTCVVHRDVKPGNILIDNERRAWITDFGLSKLYRELGEPAMDISAHVTGSPAYMAPEQWRKQGVSPQTDLYSFGVVLYEMLTRQRPFLGESVAELCHQHLHDVPLPPSRYLPHIPPDLNWLTLQCLEKKASKRPKSAREIAERLRNVSIPADPVADEHTRTLTPPDCARKGRRMAGFAVFCVLAVATIAIIAVTNRQGRRTPPDSSAKPVNYVSVPIDGRTVQARFHNLTEDRRAAVISVGGEMRIVPIDDVEFMPPQVESTSGSLGR